jgi:hypothetical protein
MGFMGLSGNDIPGRFTGIKKAAIALCDYRSHQNTLHCVKGNEKM